MNNKKSDKVFRIFNNIADRYDAANNRISLGFHKAWKNTLINEMAKSAVKSGKVLDVCCGTGDIAIALHKKRKDLKITGIDFSGAMLKIAKHKAKNDSDIIWKIANAMDLPFADNSFDTVCISFGLRNTASYQKVMSEMTRVLKKNGFIYCIDSFIPENKLILPIYNAYFKYLMPLIGGGIAHISDYNWLYQSTKEFIKKDSLAKLYHKYGITNVKGQSLMFGACIILQGQKTM